MLFRVSLAALLVLSTALAAEARIKSLPAHEPLPQAMLIPPAQVDAPQAPIQLMARAGCSCQGQSETCSCSGQPTEQCCCAGRVQDPGAQQISLAKDGARPVKKPLLKRRARK